MKIPMLAVLSVSSAIALADLHEINVESGSHTLTAEEVALGPIQKTGAGELLIDSSIDGLTDAIQIDAGSVRITGSGTEVVQNAYAGCYGNVYWPWKDGVLTIENGAKLTIGNKLFERSGYDKGKQTRTEVGSRKIYVKIGATLSFSGTDAELGSYENGGSLGQSFDAGRFQGYLYVDGATLTLPSGSFTVGGLNSGATRYGQLSLVNGSTMTGKKLIVGNRACGLGDYLIVDSSTVSLTDGIYLDPQNREWSHAGMLFKDSTITLAKLQANRPFHQNDRAVKFNNATFVPTAASTSFFSLDNTRPTNANRINQILAGGLTIDTAYNVTLDAVFDGVGGITKKGAGTLTLKYDNGYAGVTDVQVGSLVVSELRTIAAPYAVDAGATLTFAQPAAISTLQLASGATLVFTGFGSTVGSASGYTGATLTVVASEWPQATAIVTSADTDFLTWVKDQLTASVELPEGREFAVKDGSVQVVEAGVQQKRAIWTGAGADGNWSTDGNWNGNERVHSGDNLEFDGTTKLENVNDIGEVAVLDLLFPVTAGAFNLSGVGPLSIVNAISNLSANVQTIDMPVVLPGTSLDAYTVGDIALNAGVSSVQDGTRLVKMGAGKLTIAGVDAKTALDLTEGTVSVTGVTAPTQAFSSANDAVKVSGVLDAGGAAVVIADTDAKGIEAGSTLKNGAFSYSRPLLAAAEQYLPWNEGSVTFDHATFTAAKLFSGGGDRINRAVARELVLTNGTTATITASPAYIVSRDNGDGLNDNGQEDNTTPVTVRVLDGSTLALPENAFIGNWAVYAAARNGRLIVDKGSLVRGTNLSLGYRAGKGWLNVTDSTLDFTTIGLCPNAYGASYGSNGDWVTLTRATVTNKSFIVKASSYSAGSPQYVSFDDVRLVARADSTEFINKPANAPHGRIEILGGGLTADSNGHDIEIQATSDLYGVGGLTKTGAGTLTLASTNTYVGATVVEAGTLKLTGSVAGALEVGANGTIELNAAAAPSVKHAASLTFAEGAKLKVNVGGDAKGYPILLLPPGATVTGTPSIDVVGSSYKKFCFKYKETADGVLCSVVVPTGLCVIFR